MTSDSIPLVLNILSLALAAAFSPPSLLTLRRRLSPGKQPHQPPSLYSDPDGTATEESQNAFSTLYARLAVLVFTAPGALCSLAAAILVTVGLAKGSALQNWLRTGTWLLLCVQVAGLLLERQPTGRYARGIYAAVSAAGMAVALVLSNLRIGNYEYADEVLVGLLAAQAGCLVLGGLACASVRRRPVVYDEKGRVVDAQDTGSVITMLSFRWAEDTIQFMEREGKLDYEDLPSLPARLRAGKLSEGFMAARVFGRLWKTLAVHFRWAMTLQFVLITTTSVVQFLPQVSLLNLLQILESKEGRDRGDAWAWVALLGAAMFLITLIEGWLYFVIWSQLGIPIRNMLSTLVFEKAMRRKDVKGAKKAKKEETEGGEAIPNPDAAPNGETTAVANGAGGEKKDDEDDELEQKSRQSTINLIGVDSMRVSMFATFFYFYPGSIVKLTLSIVFLTLIIGWQSLLAGALAFSLTIPLNIWASKRYTSLQGELMKIRDRKLAVVTEALQGIRQIKFSALEQSWQDKIGAFRSQELATIWTTFKFDTVIISCYIMSPVLLSAACLATYTFVHGELTPSVAFTTIAILVSIENTLSILPELTTNGIDAWVSACRIEKYLNAPERVNCCEPADHIEFKDASIAWPADDETEDSDRFILRDVTVSIPPKELTVISGKTGSGKSLLLASILGEVDKLGGSIYAPHPPPLEERFDAKATKGNWIIDSAIAFVAQIPWIENATIKENILFGLPYDAGRYEKTMQTCALIKDIDMLDDGDATEIGHNGVNLSGGQRWRLSFARALYSRAGILVLDDIFSAVDAHVGRQLFEEALTGDLAAGRTRILVTHHVSLVISRAKYTVHLANGTVSHAGFVDDLKRSGSLESVLKDVKADDPDAASSSSSSTTIEDTNGDSNGAALSKVASRRSQRSAVIDEGTGVDAKGADKPKKFVEDEKLEKGGVRLAIYADYMNSSGGLWMWTPLMLAFITAAAAEAARNWWVSQWTASYETESAPLGMLRDHMVRQNVMQPSAIFQTPMLHRGNGTVAMAREEEQSNTLFYLGVYLALSLAMILMSSLKIMICFLSSIRASKVLFERLSYTVLRTPLRWLDTVPVGRILNRFTGDFNVIDSYIAMHSSFFYYKILEAITITIISFAISPLMIPLAILLLTTATLIARRFIHVARSLKRLENNGKSPIFELFGSVLTGIVTVRSYSKSDEYISRMWSRIDQHGRAFWHLWLLNRWMGFRLSLIGSLFIVAVAIVIVASRINASIAGFALSFSLQYSEAIVWVLRSYANLELDMTACERVQEYARIETETQSGSEPPAAWPAQGRLEVSNLVCGYAPDLPPVLKGLSFTAEAGQRVGVVGRTGAGKSSLTLALFRFLEAREGSVHIDGIDTATITLHALRSRLAIIPQDPVLFSGTVRSNLDAFGQHTDDELRDALERVHLTKATGRTTPTTAAGESGSATPTAMEVDSNTNPFTSLASPISEGGLNLSQGQRQLLCLARAIVARPKLMILDEATSAVDKDTDELIQRSIRDEFSGSTLLVIAHRLSTIADFDRILVMGEGRVLEFGSPAELLGKGREGGEEGVFRGMVRESGEREGLEQIIGRSGERAG